MKELYIRWLALKQAEPTLDTIAEQFYLAQRITHELHPHLYRELQDHRARCLALLRKDPAVPAKRFLGTKYNVVVPAKNARIPKWHDIELTPDISFTLSTELVGHILPASYARVLKRMIQLQVRILNAI
jgi:hypothetical protein